MVVPVSLDPGYHERRSPYYFPTESERRRKRKREAKQKAQEEHFERMIEKHRKKRIRSGFKMLFGGDDGT